MIAIVEKGAAIRGMHGRISEWGFWIGRMVCRVVFRVMRCIDSILGKSQ